MMKPSQLWALWDDSCYGSIKHLLSAVHQNPAGASGGERNHKSAKHVHSRLRARLGQAKIETGTAILFNAKQLQRQMSVTRDTRFCEWLGGEEEDLLLDVDDEEVNGPDEFDQIDLSCGIDTISDELLFASGEEELGVVDGGPCLVIL